MPSEACTNHPNEQTFVRCGRCEKPFCVRCLVDTPVGKKCRPCANNRTHLQEATARQVLLAFVASVAVAIPTAWVVQETRILILAFPMGYLVGEVALRAGQRSRSVATQVATGLAALIGGLLPMLPLLTMLVGGRWAASEFESDPISLLGFPLIITAVGVAVAVSRVRYL